MTKKGTTLKVRVDGQLVGTIVSTGDYAQDFALMIALRETKGFPIKEVPKWMAMRQQAVDFAEVAHELWKNHLRVMPEGKRPFAVVPYVMNSAFAIELYLKALSLKHGVKQPRIHQLKKLWNSQPPLARIAIAISIDEAKKHCRLSAEPEIDIWLTELNEAFQEWRYSFDYEPIKVTMDGIRFLHVLLYLACRVPLPGESPPVDAITLTRNAKATQT